VAKLLNLLGWRRRRLEDDLDRELRYHFDRRVRDMMDAGLSEPEARRQVAIEFGGVAQVRENVRDTWIWRWLDVFARDIRYSLRSLSRSWGFSLGAGAVLALAIGANTAIFSVVNAVLLRPLAYQDAARIVALEASWTNTGRTSREMSGPDFLDVQAQAKSLEVMAHSAGEDELATVVEGRGEFANARWVSGDFFSVFSQRPAAGRLLAPTDRVGDDPTSVVVVGHHWAQTYFGSSEAAVGKSILVYGRALQIVGVASPGFRYPEAADLWVPDGPTNRANRGRHDLLVVGKLKPGVDLASAQTEVRTIGARLAQEHPENRFEAMNLLSLQGRLTGHVQTTLWVLMGAVGVVLLIACANVANLLLARSSARTREIALRAALGAGRGRVVRQLLTESLVLGGLSAVAGIFLAALLVWGLVAMSPPNLPRIDEVRIDLPVLAFALGLTLLSVVAFGLLPAMNVSRLGVSDALKHGGSKGVAARGRGLRSTLVVTEVALSVVLLAASGLLLRSFQVLHHVDLGFTTERVLVAYSQFVATNDENRRKRIVFYRDLLERLRATPGVRAASGVAFLPMGRELRPAVEYSIHGRPEQPAGERQKSELQVIAPDYFRTLDIPIRLGRDFNDGDTPDRPKVAIVNETFARMAFGAESPLGQRIRIRPTDPWMEIVGVAADTRWRDPSAPPPSELFLASLQGAGGSLSILVRTTVDERSLAGTFRAVMREMNPSVPVEIETMDDLFAGALAYPRFRTQLVGGFAAVAAMLAAVGIFSVLAYLVGQRTRELAVRRAVGAQAVDVVRLIAGQGAQLIGIGLVVGLAGALAVARLLEGLLYEISPWDVSSYVGAIVVLAIAAAVGTVLPAIRAATIDPLVALRHE
jgi:predicted permease